MPDNKERTRRRRKPSRSKRPSKRVAGLLYNLAWVVAAAAIGLPLLALLLYLVGGA